MRMLKLSIFVTLTLCAFDLWAQTSTTGAVRGVVLEKGEPVIGAAVVATSPALQAPQTELTDENGVYFLSSLPPGEYIITTYYLEGQWARKGVIVGLGKTVQVNFTIDTSKAEAGETIVVKKSTPLLDQGSTKRGITVTEDYTRNIPTSRTFGGTADAAAGTQGDTYGTSFSGSTSPENLYVVNGMNTTDALVGGLETNLPNEFIAETEIISGGYQAEYGRSTGGIINVITKTGSNEFHGQVFTYQTPGALRADPKRIFREGSSISSVSDPKLVSSVGAELGGPILKDKVWFHAGLNREDTLSDLNRIVSSRIDANNDGVPDVDPSTGFTLTEEVARSTRAQNAKRLYYTGNISFAAAAEHQGSLSVFGAPRSSVAWGTVTGPVESGKIFIKDGAYDTTFKWTSKFNKNKQQLDFQAGWHRGISNQSPGYLEGLRSRVRYDYDLPLARFENIAACQDGSASDLYPMIDNCPVRFYSQGGVGLLSDQTSDRLAAKVSFINRFNLVGQHIVKVGADVEDNYLDTFRAYTGGFSVQHRSGFSLINSYKTPDDNGDIPCGAVDIRSEEEIAGADLDGNGVIDTGPDGIFDGRCSARPDGLNTNSNTFNLSAFLQDSWQPMPNLTINAGLRWERQALRNAKQIQGTTSLTTGVANGKNAFALDNMLAPRFGAIWDWTKEGRSKLYGQWGRFYESIPMDINDRAFGGEVGNITVVEQCANLANPANADQCANAAVLQDILFGGGELVAPGIKAQYLDELSLGVEYELFEDFSLSVAYINRRLGRVIEDVSSDGGGTYVIANPGEINQGDIDSLRQQADQIESMDPVRADLLRFQADQFEQVGKFDKPKRDYNALEVLAKKRFSHNVFGQASYTFSKTRGNFPGLFSPDTGQLDPNLTSMYDLPDLMANRFGDLPQDLPHRVKVDGYYLFQLAPNSALTTGGSVRMASGVPHNVLGSHPSYGTGETFVLPRGSSDRSPISSSLDIHLGYAHQLTKGTRLEGFFDIFNLFNQQPQLDVDENYTFDNVNPIVGGDQDDLRHLKALDPSNDKPTATLAEENPNFLNTSSRQAPLSVRLGLRLSF